MPYDWEWERTEAGRPGMSGDIAKLFRHEEPKAPGMFAINAPPAAATLLAREVIQNSWDAARDLQSQDSLVPQFEIEFEFRELRGNEKRSLVETLALESLAVRAANIDRAKLGLSPHDCLDTIRQDDPLRVLLIKESAASGMYGPWEQNKSNMFMALLSIGFTEKFTGGGSYGYGKAGLINGSRIRSVFAYSCFRERSDDPGITRRLLGITYWGPHDFDGINHPGIGTFSSGAAGNILPFQNEEADEIATRLGFHLRTASNNEDLGTTFMLIDTPIDPPELLRAIERSWWPALHEGDFSASIIDCDGSTLSPRPLRDPVLHSFIEGWEVAVGRSSSDGDKKQAKISGPDQQNENAELAYPNAGVLGMVADLSDWSYADHLVTDGSDDVMHKSLIALTRSPRMVVEYFEAGHSPPYVRGVFVADESIDNELRKSEPKAHDSWRTKGEDGEVDPEAAALAKHVLQRIKQNVNNFRGKLKPPTPPPEKVNLPFFNDIMRKVLSGAGKGIRKPVPDVRPISIRLDYELSEAAAPGLIELSGQAVFSLSDHFVGNEASVVLTIAYRFLEDERVGDFAPLEIQAPEGFVSREGGDFLGELRRNKDARFTFVSAAYDPDWSGRLIVNGEVSAPSHSVGDEG